MAKAEKGPTKKHIEFVSEPIRDKDITKIPGIGPKLAVGFRKEGCIKAQHVLGVFLSPSVHRDRGKFKDFVRKCGGDEGQQEAVYKAMKEWTDSYV